MNLETISLSSKPVQSSYVALAMAALAFIAYLPLTSVFTPNDHQGYVNIVEETGRATFDASEAKGKVAVALVYSVMSRFADYRVFTISAFILFLFMIARHAKNIQTLFLYFVLIAPISPYFWYITKEALLLLISIAAILWSQYISKKQSPFIFFSLILVFSIFIRNYYIPLILASLFLSFNISRQLKLGGTIIAFIMTSFSNGLISFIYDSKYQMWARLYYYSEVNTLFQVDFVNNPNMFDLIFITISNYAQIIYTPIRFFDHRGLIVFIHLTCFILVLSSARKHGLKSLFYFVLLLFLFLGFMVPDSGTFIRHVSALTFALATSFLINGKSIENYRASKNVVLSS